MPYQFIHLSSQEHSHFSTEEDRKDKHALMRVLGPFSPGASLSRPSAATSSGKDGLVNCKGKLLSPSTSRLSASCSPLPRMVLPFNRSHRYSLARTRLSFLDIHPASTFPSSSPPGSATKIATPLLHMREHKTRSIPAHDVSLSGIFLHETTLTLAPHSACSSLLAILLLALCIIAVGVSGTPSNLDLDAVVGLWMPPALSVSTFAIVCVPIVLEYLARLSEGLGIGLRAWNGMAPL